MNTHTKMQRNAWMISSICFLIIGISNFSDGGLFPWIAFIFGLIDFGIALLFHKRVKGA
ncbi:MAG: hypothetical protein ACRCST_06250 [Turicibacter sp.]